MSGAPTVKPLIRTGGPSASTTADEPSRRNSVTTPSKSNAGMQGSWPTGASLPTPVPCGSSHLLGRCRPARQDSDVAGTDSGEGLHHDCQVDPIAQPVRARCSEPACSRFRRSRHAARRRQPAAAPTTTRPADAARVLLVGTFNGHAGKYTVDPVGGNAARAGDWILVAPGDYHETADTTGPASEYVVVGRLRRRAHQHVEPSPARHEPQLGDRRRDQAGWLAPAVRARPSRTSAASAPTASPTVATASSCGRPTASASTTSRCATSSRATSRRATRSGGTAAPTPARSVCTGIPGQLPHRHLDLLQRGPTARSTGSSRRTRQGPATWTTTYASNFNDSGMYVGACLQLCDITIDHAWMEYNALGYSGTNSGGAIVIEHSEFDNNQDGLDTNTQIAGDPPRPAERRCPNNGISPITHTHSCWVFEHNNVHDNNNPNVPAAGSAAAGPGRHRHDALRRAQRHGHGQHLREQRRLGRPVRPLPRQRHADPGQTCAGTGGVQTAGLGCVYDPEGNALLHNTFSHNGFFGNPTNGDFGQITISAHQPSNCYAGNTAPDGSAPANLETPQPTAAVPPTAANTGGALLAQVLCDTGFGTCPAGAKYPKPTGVVMHPLPKTLASMPNPCAGVPANAWCVGRQACVSHCGTVRRGSARTTPAARPSASARRTARAGTPTAARWRRSLRPRPPGAPTSRPASPARCCMSTRYTPFCASSVEIQIAPPYTSAPCVWCSTSLMRNGGSGFHPRVTS